MAKFYSCGFNLIILSLIITNVISQLFEGDVCKTDENNVAWKCTKLTLCETAFERLRDEKPPPSCGFAGNIPIVCCEPKGGAQGNQPPSVPDVTPFRERPQSSAGSSISEQKCKEYAKYVFKDQEVYFPDYEDESPAGNKEKIDTCHNIKPLIVGGTPAAPREFPHQVNIGYQYGNVKKWLCTGSLISENFVLSAAHCSRTSRFGRAKFAVVGDLDIGSVRDEADPEEIKIAEIINHPSYRSPYNDIALFRLERNVSLNEFKRPACLQRDRVLPSNNAVATGWGNIRTGGPSSNRLLKADLEIIPKATCDIYFHKGNPLTRGIDDEQMICAGDLKGIKDTCQGDSGGPLQISLRNPYCMYSVVGVTSFGKQCGSQIPGVYTRVSYYVPWIESVVWG